MPEGFERYARVFHPVIRQASFGPQHLSWRAIARANGRVVHREMQFANIAWTETSRAGGVGWPAPRTGCLAAELAAALARILGAHTATPSRCWFAVWEGWGGLEEDLPGYPRFEHPARRYYLAEGDVSAAARSVYGPQWHYQSPSMWWPDDRAWFVATEVDLDSTYVGGREDCVEDLLAHPGIESMPAELGDDITAASDRVNPAPPVKR